MTLKSECPLPNGIWHSTIVETSQPLEHVVENIGNVVGEVANGGFFLRRHRQRIEQL
jgi:hypothetical protein